MKYKAGYGHQQELWKFYPPKPNVTFNLVAIPPFDGTFATFNKMDIHGDIEYRGNDFDNLIEWESSNDGFIGQGSVISADTLKATLTSGNHRITAKIDSNGESGEKKHKHKYYPPNRQFYLA
ncbi:MAG: hypothetical protein L3J53_08055 [Proteobacteria bacterium]|nr:hypothetical protein [Pseudomonadota bacterium]